MKSQEDAKNEKEKKSMGFMRKNSDSNYGKLSNWFREFFNYEQEETVKKNVEGYMDHFTSILMPKDKNDLSEIESFNTVNVLKKDFMSLSAKEKSFFIRERAKKICNEMVTLSREKSYKLEDSELKTLTDQQVTEKFAEKVKDFLGNEKIDDKRKKEINDALGLDIELYKELNASQKSKYIAMGLFVSAMGLALLVCSVPLLLAPLGVALPAVPVLGSALGMKITMAVASVISSITGMKMEVPLKVFRDLRLDSDEPNEPIYWVRDRMEGEKRGTFYTQINEVDLIETTDYGDKMIMSRGEWIHGGATLNQNLIKLSQGLQGACLAVSGLFMLKQGYDCYKEYSAITGNESLLKETYEAERVRPKSQ